MSLTLLIVEDDPAEVARLRALLTDAGHDVLAAATAEVGFLTAKTCRPDMAIISTRLPDGHGLELLRRLREDVETKGITVMLANPLFTDDEWFQGCLHGSDFHWERPVDGPEVVQLVAFVEQQRSGNET